MVLAHVSELSHWQVNLVVVEESLRIISLVAEWTY